MKEESLQSENQLQESVVKTLESKHSRLGKRIRQGRYLVALIESQGDKKEAGKIAKVNERTWQRWFQIDRKFQEAVDGLLPKFLPQLKLTAIKKALNGDNQSLWRLIEALDPMFDPNLRAEAIRAQATIAAGKITGEHIQQALLTLQGDPANLIEGNVVDSNSAEGDTSSS